MPTSCPFSTLKDVILPVNSNLELTLAHLKDVKL